MSVGHEPCQKEKERERERDWPSKDAELAARSPNAKLMVRWLRVEMFLDCFERCSRHKGQYIR